MFIQDIYPPIYLCTSCRCSGNSAFVPHHLPGHQGCVFRVFCIFSETIYLDTRVVFSGFPHIAVVFFAGFLHIPGICTAFLHVCDIYIQDIYPLYLDTRLFFLGFPHIAGTCTAFLPVCDIFIRDIYPANYLCTSCRCSRHFTFFPGQLPGHLGCFIKAFCASTCPRDVQKTRKKQPGVRVIVPGKVRNFRSIFGMHINNLVGKCLE